MTRRPLTRRQLLERTALGGAALSLPGFLAACGGGGGIEGAATTTTATTAERKLAAQLTVSNWPLYIDVDEKTKKRPTLDQFQLETGVEVKYLEDYNSNEEFFGKIQGPLSRGQSIDRDVIVPTAFMAARLKKLGWLEPLARDAIPNAKNLDDSLAHPSWDPDRAYSLPWQSFIAGIGYDPDRVGGEITSLSQLLDDPKLKGKVTLLNELQECVGLLLLDMGKDPAKISKADFDAVVARLRKAVDSGQVRQFTGNDYTGPLAKGDVWAAMAWSGDVVQLQADNPKLRFVVPDAGGMILTDTMVIPKGGDAYTASVFMDFYYRPDVAAKVAAYVNYISPVKGAKEEMIKLDPDLASNPLVFPPPATLAKLHEFDPTALENAKFREAFQGVVGA